MTHRTMSERSTSELRPAPLIKKEGHALFIDAFDFTSRSSQCSTTGVTKAVVCIILSLMHIK